MDVLLDTSVWIALEDGRPLGEPPDGQAFTSVVVLGELEAGVLAAADVTTRSRRLATLRDAREHAEPLVIDEAVASRYAELAVLAAGLRPRPSQNDLWIAATALTHGLAVCTQDDDFDALPGVEVVRV